MKRIQRKQIPIARDDCASAARKRDIEELVVVGIAACPDLALDMDNACNAAQQSDEVLPILTAHIGIEFSTAKHLGQFREGGFGYEQNATGKRVIEGPGCHASRNQQSANQDVGIENP